jgi:hypothetical protein
MERVGGGLRNNGGVAGESGEDALERVIGQRREHKTAGEEGGLKVKGEREETVRWGQTGES